MNKIYRVVWNATLGRWVVASEMAKSAKKTSMGRHAAFAAAMTMGTFAVMGDASAGALDGGQIITGSGVAYGPNATVNITKVSEVAQNGTAVGGNSFVGGQDGTAIGSQVRVTNVNGVGIGNDIVNDASAGVAIGGNAGSYVMIDAASTAGTAIGSQSIIVNSVGGTALGVNASVKNAPNGLSLGSNSNTSVDSGVALGSGSVANTAAGIAGYDPTTGKASTNTSAAWVSTKGAVSIGNAAGGGTRQITGLAAGSADTDAVNVAQLKRITSDSTANAVMYDNSTHNGITLSGDTYNNTTHTGGTKITNVADGSAPSDAVNYSQLSQTNQSVTNLGDTVEHLYLRYQVLPRQLHRH
ncbi:MAG: ESPR-type extended signal peptide-containing protein [Pseudomonas sp.]